MYEVKKYVPKVRLISRAGSIWEYNSMSKAYYIINSRRLWTEIGNSFKDSVYSFRFIKGKCIKVVTFPNYILRTELGDVITVDELRDYSPPKRPYFLYRHLPFKFRKGSVPNIHCSRGGFHYYRKIKTTQEHRANRAVLTDEDAKLYRVKVRGKRAKNFLPNTWDDIIYSDITIKNWKKYRRTQYKN